MDNDVREALLQVIDTWWSRPRLTGTAAVSQADTMALRDAVLAAFEVRPRGSVTDAEVEATKVAAETAFEKHVRQYTEAGW